MVGAGNLPSLAGHAAARPVDEHRGVAARCCFVTVKRKKNELLITESSTEGSVLLVYAQFLKREVSRTTWFLGTSRLICKVRINFESITSSLPEPFGVWSGTIIFLQCGIAPGILYAPARLSGVLEREIIPQYRSPKT